MTYAHALKRKQVVSLKDDLNSTRHKRIRYDYKLHRTSTGLSGSYNIGGAGGCRALNGVLQHPGLSFLTSKRHTRAQSSLAFPATVHGSLEISNRGCRCLVAKSPAGSRPGFSIVMAQRYHRKRFVFNPGSVSSETRPPCSALEKAPLQNTQSRDERAHGCMVHDNNESPKPIAQSP